MSETSARFVERSQERMDSNESAGKSYILRTREELEDELYSENDEELSDDEDPYWDTDELGIDPEDLYDAANGI